MVKDGKDYFLGSDNLLAAAGVFDMTYDLDKKILSFKHDHKNAPTSFS